MPSTFDKDTRAKAVRLVKDHVADYGSEWTAIRAVHRMICQFITEHRPEFGVAPICGALTELGVPIAPRTYLLGARGSAAVETRSVEHVDHRTAGWVEYARRAGPSATGGAAGEPENVGAPAAAGCAGGPLHRRAADAQHGWRGARRATKVGTTVAASRG